MLEGNIFRSLAVLDDDHYILSFSVGSENEIPRNLGQKRRRGDFNKKVFY